MVGWWGRQWGHVFATVYWLNVRNDYRVDDFEVHNEPNNRGQGWGGTEADYFELVRYTHDAIDSVFSTYLPGRAHHVYAPVTSGVSSWPLDALQQVPAFFDSVDVHSYSSDITDYVRMVHAWMESTSHASYPLWLSEWSTYLDRYHMALDRDRPGGEQISSAAHGPARTTSTEATSSPSTTGTASPEASRTSRASSRLMGPRG